MFTLCAFSSITNLGADLISSITLRTIKTVTKKGVVLCYKIIMTIMTRKRQDALVLGRVDFKTQHVLSCFVVCSICFRPHLLWRNPAFVSSSGFSDKLLYRS